MLNHIGHSFRKGDTLIEVMFAVGVFGLAAVGAISLMNRGLATAQNTLEITMARQEIDGQAEILRFLHSAYMSNKDPISEDPCSEPQSYRDLWKCITTNYVYNPDEIETADKEFYSRTVEPGEHCDTLFHADGKDDQFSIPSKSFILNYRNLGSADIDNANLKNVISSSTLVRTTGTYPRLIFTNSAVDCEKDENKNRPECTLSDATITTNAASMQRQLQSAEGVWVTAVASNAGVQCVDEEKPRPDFYDFHIQTCWDAVAGNMPSTIGSTVRLFNPDQVVLTSKQSTITFENTYWEKYDKIKNKENEGSIGEECGDVCAAASCTANKGVYSEEHTITSTTGDTVNITFSGYTENKMDEGVRHTIDGVNHFTIDIDMDISRIEAHPGGKLTIKFGPVKAVVSDNNTITVTAGSNSKTMSGHKFHLILEKDGGTYNACLDNSCVSTTGDGNSAEIDYNFQHDTHACGCISKVYLTNITMTNHDPAANLENGGCVRHTYKPEESEPEPEPESQPEPEPQPQPEPEPTTMQGFQCTSLAQGEKVTLTDVRDNNTYTVSKLRDGNCWMTSGLRFEGSSVDPSTSDVISTHNISWSGSANGSTETVPAKHFFNEMMYSRAGATATTNGEGEESICPKGWKLPTKAQANAIVRNHSGFTIPQGTQYITYWTSSISSNRHWGLIEYEEGKFRSINYDDFLNGHIAAIRCVKT